VDELLEQSQRRIFTVLHPPAPVPTRIEFDNESSRNYTVVDVLTGDRTGLLYELARAFHKGSMNIASARIVTDARRVRDSFYITFEGKKISDETIKMEIEERLRNAIHLRYADTIEEVSS